LSSVESAPKLQRLINLDHDERVQDNDSDVGDDLHDKELAPEGVELLVVMIFTHGSLPDIGFIVVGKDVSFHLKKLENSKQD
jgi:hypothetical protein